MLLDMDQDHEVGRASYEMYCGCIGSEHCWGDLKASAKEIWRKVEIAGLQASARALACTAEQPIASQPALAG